MHKLFILLFALLLSACSKSDNLTLKCYGTLMTSIRSSKPDVSEITRTYKFSNMKFANYECTTEKHLVHCDAVKDENGVRERKRIVYDTKTESFTEIIRVLDLAKSNEAQQTTISKSEFIGKCQKPVIQ